MKKYFNTTSKTEYKTPILEIEELDKQDILTSSDNQSVDSQEWLGDSGGIGDLFDALVGNS